MASHIPTYGTFFEFKKDDVFHNRIKAYPNIEFFIYSGSVYYNNENQHAENKDITTGHLSLYELNVNRQAHSASGDTQLIKPFITKNGSFYNFRTISSEAFSDFNNGDTIEGTYPLTSSISIDRYDETLTDAKRNVLTALKSTLNYYSIISPHYTYSSSLGDKEAQKLNLISIPSIFFGSSIKKGSVNLKFHITGSVVGEAEDTYRDGRIFATTGSNAGEVIGVALYNEGFLFLTSSTVITAEHSEEYGASTTLYNPSWNYFGNLTSLSSTSSSYSISLKGVNFVETITMFAHAKKNQLNFSVNPTFTSGQPNAYIASDLYHENSKMPLTNIVSSSYKNYSASFANTTFISKVGIYDENKNLIAIAGLANPVKKTEDRAYTFKLKLDI
tara:strand:+ start:3618 stop:4781 length:1164 start_codon:yes stop_codon:yes gene_type:complete